MLSYSFNLSWVLDYLQWSSVLNIHEISCMHVRRSTKKKSITKTKTKILRDLDENEVHEWLLQVNAAIKKNIKPQDLGSKAYIQN
jgi:hypothetical protein